MGEPNVTDGALYVTALRVHDLKGIKNAELELRPGGGLIVVSGPTGAGKTSLTDAIPWTLAGDRDIDQMPVRAGADQASTFVRLEGPGFSHAYEVEKTILGRDKIRLRVRVDGSKKDAPSPQSLLSAFIGDLSFDPSELKTMSEARRRQIFERMVHLPVSLGELQARNDTLFKQRHDAKVILDRLVAQVQGLEEVPSGAPAVEVDVRGILEELDAAQTINKENAWQRDEYSQLPPRIEARRVEIARLQAELDRLLSLQQQETAKAACPPALASVDESPIRDRLERASEVNKAFGVACATRDRNAAKIKERDVQQQTWDGLDEQLQSLRTDRRVMLDEAVIPVAGLSVNDDGIVTFRGIPLDQCSDGESIDLGMEVGMALNPTLRLIRVKNASLLDEVTRERVAQKAIDRGYLVLMEVAAAPGKGTGFVVEEGEIVARPENNA